jgi:hypothetical protein
MEIASLNEADTPVQYYSPGNDRHIMSDARILSGEGGEGQLVLEGRVSHKTCIQI